MKLRDLSMMLFASSALSSRNDLLCRAVHVSKWKWPTNFKSTHVKFLALTAMFAALSEKLLNWFPTLYRRMQVWTQSYSSLSSETDIMIIRDTPVSTSERVLSRTCKKLMLCSLLLSQQVQSPLRLNVSVWFWRSMTSWCLAERKSRGFKCIFWTVSVRLMIRVN